MNLLKFSSPYKHHQHFLNFPSLAPSDLPPIKPYKNKAHIGS